MNPLGYERILVPTDMSDFANQAIRYAALLRDRLGARITLLYADETYFPVDVLEVPLGYYLEQAPATKAKLQERLREYAAEHLPEGGAETMVVQDAPARAIVHTAREMNADLVVMDRDYLTIPPDQIKDIKPKMAMVGGGIAYDAMNPAASTH